MPRHGGVHLVEGHGFDVVDVYRNVKRAVDHAETPEKFHHRMKTTVAKIRADFISGLRSFGTVTDDDKKELTDAATALFRYRCDHDAEDLKEAARVREGVRLRIMSRENKRKAG